MWLFSSFARTVDENVMQVAGGIVSLNLSGYTGQINFSQISDAAKKRKADVESDSESPRSETCRSPDQLSTVRKKHDSRIVSPPPCSTTAKTAAPISEDLEAIFASIRSSGGSMSLEYSGDSDKGVFSFLGRGKSAARSGAVEVSCSNYDPTKKKPDDLVCLLNSFDQCVSRNSHSISGQILGRKGGQGVLATAAHGGGPTFFEFTLAEGLELELSSYLLRNGSR